jgi:Flp pilus assembly protein TadB
VKWLNKLKEYAPSIASAVLTGGATLPALAIKAVKDATGVEINNETELESFVESATPEQLLKVKQADNSFKIRMRELDNELVATELGDVQNARKHHAGSRMPAAICITLTVGLFAFIAALMVTTIPPENARMIDMIFGSYLTAWISSIAYHVGTSRSSSEKNAALMKRRG